MTYLALIEKMVNDQLCNQCQLIFVSSTPTNKYRIRAAHHSDGQSLTQAAKLGCYLCAWSWKRHDSNYSVQRTTYELYFVDASTFRLSIILHSTDNVEHNVFLGWQDSGLPSIVTQSRSLSPSVRSNESLQLATSWLDDCVLNHTHCREIRNDRKLPTRLVCVRSDLANSNVIANIYYGDKLLVGTPYLTLSHCWGPDKFLTTTKANIHQFENSIPISALSQAFQDALLLTVKLGFQYIWIDSLCIVQDDPKDWEHEAKLMGEVYSNSLCNISASAFADGKEGFMLKQRRLDPSPIPIEVNWLTSQSDPSRDTDSSKYWIMCKNPLYDIAKGPLFGRAWTLQEQLLAPRALHFGQDQIFWECNQLVANEIWPRGWTSVDPSHHTGSMWQFKMGDTVSQSVSPYAIWSNIVGDYTTRRLTYAKDREPALAGIASKFGTLLEDRYLCGLWRKDLHRGLLFGDLGIFLKPFTARLTSRQDNENDGNELPTWSWVKCPSPVAWKPEFWKISTLELCQIDTSNQLDTKTLQIDGMIIPMVSDDFRYLTVGEYSIAGTNKKGFDIEIEPDLLFFSPFETRLEATEKLEFDTAMHEFRAAASILPLLYRPSNSPRIDGTYEAIIEGLLISPQSEQSGECYFRVGVAQITIIMPGRASAETVLEVLLHYLRSHASSSPSNNRPGSQKIFLR